MDFLDSELCQMGPYLSFLGWFLHEFMAALLQLAAWRQLQLSGPAAQLSPPC
uniref:Uncharacterized protein n=1 Tax=Arundo donax TaxID=35708 RepID=A0A0A9FZD7_ARUDO